MENLRFGDCWTNVVGHSKLISSLFVLWFSSKFILIKTSFVESSKLIMFGAMAKTSCRKLEVWGLLDKSRWSQ